MQRCESCGSDVPVNAHFCGNCGHLLPDRTQSAIEFTYPPATGTPAPNTPPLFSSPSYPDMLSTAMGQEDTGATFQASWSDAEMARNNPQFPERRTDENETLQAEMLLPWMLPMEGQLPSAGQAPIVQGTPQVGGVPSVQGTPAAPGNAPPSGPGFAHGAGSSAPPHAPNWAPQAPPHQSLLHHTQPVHHPQPQPPLQHRPGHHPQPEPPHAPEHHQHHHSGPLHARRPRTSRLHGSTATGATSKLAVGTASKWIIVALAAVVVIATSSILLSHAFVPASQPGLTITGTNVVRDGGILHLHGQGFQPGGSITLTIDNGLPASLAGQHGTRDISQGTERSANVAGLSQMSIFGEFQARSVADTNITVSSSGTFDANITVPLSLPGGKHTIHATENQGSQSASLQFSVLSPEIAVNPTALNFGTVEVGRTVRLSVTVSNQGGASLHWTATVEGSNTNWLTLPNSTGVIETNASDETVTVAADTNGLSVGPHSATLRIHSDNGDVQIPVSLNVVPHAQGAQQAILNVPQQNLDFGQLQTGQQVQQSISIANLGSLPLKWLASRNAASAGWLSLATTSGTVQPGATPQTVQVNVNTTGLAAGSYSGTITITSNGGNATVSVTFGATAVSPTPAPPTPSPTTPTTLSPSPSSSPTPTVTGIRPSGGPGTGGTAVVITGTGFTGATSVSFGQTAASNVSVKSDIQITATSPAGSGTVDVTVTTPGGTSASSAADQFTYTAPPTWSVSPNSLDSSTCGSSAPCTVTLAEDATSTVNIDWSASSDVGATFNPPSGTLTPSGQQQVSISGMTCQQNGTFTFTGSGGVKPLTVSWSCPPPPTWSVNPTKLTNLDVTACSGGTTWTCTVTLTEDANSQVNIIWSSSSDQSKVIFTPASGTLSPGQSVPVTVSSIPCSHTEFRFTGSGGAQPLTALWDCQRPPLLTVTASGNCPPDSSGNYICTDTLTVTGSQGSITWSGSEGNDLPGTTLTPPSTTLSVGQSQTVTVTIPGIDCPKGGHYVYSWPGNTYTVTFTCPTPTPSPSPSPTSLPTPTPTPTPSPAPSPSGSPTLSLSLPFVPSLILFACMIRFYVNTGRTTHRKRKPRR